MSAIGTYACFQSWIPLINGCINCALFNAVSNVYLHNWKEWVMHQTKCCNNVTMTSLSGRKINKQIKTLKQMPSDMKRTILANMNVKLYWWPLTFHKWFFEMANKYSDWTIKTFVVIFDGSEQGKPWHFVRDNKSSVPFGSHCLREPSALLHAHQPQLRGYLTMGAIC